MDEDCLYLNVTAPKACRHAPVLFWIHGGAFQKGSGLLGIRPEQFTAEGFVVVSCNYRLGALGFLDVSRWLGDSYCQSGNSGLLDIIQALRWVRDNISAFGGDPDHVTVMGQSAGAKLCGALTIAADSDGLFRRAVLCSGAVQCIRDRHTAQSVAEQFFAEAGLTRDRAAELLTLPWQQILRAQTPLFTGLNLHAVGPVFDGVTFAGDEAQALLRSSTGRTYDLLLGTNRDEMELYWHVYGVHELDEALAVRLFGNRAPVVLDAAAKLPRDASWHERLVHFLTEYVYRACHASETQFLMGMGLVIRDMDRSPAHEALGQAMRSAFISFMKTGRPEAPGLPAWPRFTAEDRQMMVFNGECHVAETPPVETDPRMPYAVFALD